MEQSNPWHSQRSLSSMLLCSGTWLTRSWLHLSQVLSALEASVFPSSCLQYKREEERQLTFAGHLR